MKKLCLFMLLYHCVTFTMESSIVSSNDYIFEKVAMVDTFPFYITQSGCYLFPFKQEIKVKDVYDRDQVRDLKGIRYVHGMINIPSNNVAAIVIDLNGSTIDSEGCYFPVVSMNNIHNDRLRIKVCNGTIKNNRSRATILAFLKNITIHDVKFENCKMPIIANSDMSKIFNVTVVNDDENEKKEEESFITYGAYHVQHNRKLDSLLPFLVQHLRWKEITLSMLTKAEANEFDLSS